MNVLFVASYSGMSGANHSLVNLIKLLRSKGVNPFVLIPTRGKIEEELIKNDIPYKRIRLFNWIIPIDSGNSKKEKFKWFVKNIINLLQEVRISKLIIHEKIELVHINAVTASWGVNAAKKNKVPIVWHIREFLEEDLNKRFRNKRKATKKLGKADVVIAISKSVEEKYSGIINNKKLVTIYNGIDHTRYSGLKNDILLGDPIVLTIAGRIVKEKGHEEVIYALQRVIESGVKSIKLQIVGDTGNNAFISKIKQLVLDLNLNEYVYFLGYIKDIESIWSQTDIAMVSSKSEAFGRVTVEAMLAGALVIGADTGGTRELLLDGKYGLIYEQGNYKSLAEKIIYAINNVEEMRGTIQHAKEYAKENFTADNNAQQIYEVYKSRLD